MRMMEDPEMRTADRQSRALLLPGHAEEGALRAQGRTLSSPSTRKRHEADLTEKGREFLNPDDPDAFVLPDLGTALRRDRRRPRRSPTSRRSPPRTNSRPAWTPQAERIHNISQLLKAYCLYEKDVQYVVEDNKVIIVDENTGRKMPGRRWSDGLHQAVEAKEGVQIDKRNPDPRHDHDPELLPPLSETRGMTGTAETEAAEFHDIYKLDVLVDPDQPPDHPRSTRTTRSTRRGARNSTRSSTKIEEAPRQGPAGPRRHRSASRPPKPLARMLKREKIPHTVLNAKFHQQEAEIVARAGQRGAVTISTNMAGRGTDIKLGAGRRRSSAACYVIGTERHESRRIDRQLRGRCARQGDPGASQVLHLSFEDDLMRNFGAADRMTKIMERFGLEGRPGARASVAEHAPSRPRRSASSNATTLVRKRVARFRRRDEQAARGRLRLPQRSHRHRRPARAALRGHRRSRPGQSRRILRHRRRRPQTTPACSTGSTPPSRSASPTKPPASRPGRRRQSPTCIIEQVKDAYELKSSTRSTPTPSKASSATSSSTPSTASGRSTSTPWTRCARASISAPTGRRIRSSNTRPRPTSMFAELMANIKNEVLQQSLPQHLQPPGLRRIPRQPPPATQRRRQRRRSRHPAPRLHQPQAQTPIPPGQTQSQSAPPQNPPSIQLGGSGTITLSGGFPIKPKPKPPA